MDTKSDFRQEITYSKGVRQGYAIGDISNGITNDVVSFVTNPQISVTTISVLVTVYDVASYILGKIGSCTTMKLHKLLYYCQAWSLVWDEKALFRERIEAWANGPVVKDLFRFHRGLYEVSAKDFVIGNQNVLSAEQRDTVNSVLKFYGDKSSQWLINLTHSEQPWIEARRGLGPMERGSAEIKLDAMANYYSSL